mmetsp:Transcript_19047/g.29788  ORF Transcript_19047/g.29788 Transcript_19047/m.29788 type:complete len:221 (+) Transcript_19047:355-1017(+)
MRLATAAFSRSASLFGSDFVALSALALAFSVSLFASLFAAAAEVVVTAVLFFMTRDDHIQDEMASIILANPSLSRSLCPDSIPIGDISASTYSYPLSKHQSTLREYSSSLALVPSASGDGPKETPTHNLSRSPKSVDFSVSSCTLLSELKHISCDAVGDESKTRMIPSSTVLSEGVIMSSADSLSPAKTTLASKYRLLMSRRCRSFFVSPPSSVDEDVAK